MTDLFDDDQGGDQGGENGATVPARAPGHGGAHGGARPGAGRKPGSLARVNQELRQHLVQLTGRDAIVEQYRLASVPIMLERTTLLKLARYFGCSPKEAVELWLKAAALVYPHIYPKLGSIELRPPGAVEDGGFGSFLDDIEGDGIEIADGAEPPRDNGGDITDLPIEALSREAIEEAIAEAAAGDADAALHRLIAERKGGAPGQDDER